MRMYQIKCTRGGVSAGAAGALHPRFFRNTIICTRGLLLNTLNSGLVLWGLIVLAFQEMKEEGQILEKNNLMMKSAKFFTIKIEYLYLTALHCSNIGSG